VSLASAAGLDVDGGVLVDASLRTSDPDVLAVGDIAAQDHPLLPGRVRVEHWATALKMPKTAAAVMLGGDDVYAELPYFYTDQFDLGMEYVGYVEPGEYERVVFRGDPATGEYIAFWTTGDRVLAGMNVNVWDVVDDVKALVASGRPIDPARLADPAVPLAELA
jgi:3-phenylpropionate/trans-cinnamate dioxygenase ferredoxin reductase subunit